MRLKLRLTGFTLVAAFLVLFAAAPVAGAASASSATPSARPKTTATAAFAPAAAHYTDPATGTAYTGTFSNGVAHITSFGADTANRTLVANGYVTGTFTSADGTFSKTFTRADGLTFNNALVDPPASCSILNLTLGPLHLDLLGLVVDLNQVHLTITAQQGPGNLLGNLLCAVTNLLNGNGALSGIQNLLNRINAILTGL